MDRELQKRVEDKMLVVVDDITNYILNHMINPPGTLKMFALDLKAAAQEVRKKRGEHLGAPKE